MFTAAVVCLESATASYREPMGMVENGSSLWGPFRFCRGRLQAARESQGRNQQWATLV